MVMNHIRGNIEEDIQRIKEHSDIDISPEIGKVFYNFVNYWKNRDYQSATMKLPQIIDRLETYLVRRVYSSLLLTGIRRSASEIETIIKRHDKEKLIELELYFSGLKQRKSNNHATQLPQRIPEELL
jgi:hypothetical protein